MESFEHWEDVLARWERLQDDENFDAYDGENQVVAVARLTPKELAKALEDVRGCDCCVERGRLLKDAVIERVLAMLERV